MKDFECNKPKPIMGMQSNLTFRIAKIQNQLNTHAIATLSAHSELTLTQWRMIVHIHSKPEITAAGIVRQSQIDKSQISRALKSLRTRNFLVVSESTEDQRQSKLRLSAKGREAHSKVIAVMRERQSMLTQDLDKSELDIFFSVLERLENRARGNME